MKALHSSFRAGFSNLTLIITVSVILFGAGVLAWEWHGAHPSGKSHTEPKAKSGKGKKKDKDKSKDPDKAGKHHKGDKPAADATK